MSPVLLLQFIGGLISLVGGAYLLVEGATRLARAAGVPPLVVGLTVVAYGTSAPELAVSLQAAVAGSAGVAVGNVVGSNIFNVLFVLGISALIAPLVVDRDVLRRDIWVMIGVSAILWALSADGSVNRLEGLGLTLGGFGYTVWLVRSSRAAARTEAKTDEAEHGGSRIGRAIVEVVVGLALLVLGANWLVQSATAWAQSLGVSDLIIGLTVVAAGTSLPEVAASVAAALRGERDLAVGNVVGSNIFNILFVLGLSAAVSPGAIEVSAGAWREDMPVMLAAAIACLPAAFTFSRIDRWEGALFVAAYAGYVVWLFLSATEHEQASAYGAWMLWFVGPLVGLTFLVLAVQQWRRESGGRA